MANFPPNRMSLSDPSSDALQKVRETEPMLDEKRSPSADDRLEDGFFSHRFRYLILILGCLCLTSICSNMITFNFTLICMHKEIPVTGVEIVPGNITSSMKLAKFEPMFDQKEKSWLMWAVAIGSIIATFPFNVAYAHYGARVVFFSAGMMSAIATLLIPLCINFGLGYFLIARVVQGIAFGADFAAIGVVCARWASLKQNGIFISILTLFSSLSSAITNPSAGALCESSWGWQSVYYIHGAVGCILFSLWLIFYTDHPDTHRNVSSVELEKIHRNKTAAHIKMDSYIPYWAIVTNPTVLVVWLNALADIGSGIFLLTYTPTYINAVLHYNVGKTGAMGALLALSHIPFKLVTGYLSDKLKGPNERLKMICFNSIALVIPGMMYAALGYVPDDRPMIAIWLFTGIYGFLGANCGGFYKCGTLVSRQYSAFVVSNIQFIKCITLFLAPLLVHIFITHDSNKAEWRTIFFILAGLLFISNFIFCFVATDEPAEFTKITRETAREMKEIKKNGNKNGTQIPA
jgi:ACS family sodium-dependent inorganic phosphate cotransporter-like MFS transporter 5